MKDLEIIFVDHMDEVLKVALLPREEVPEKEEPATEVAMTAR